MEDCKWVWFVLQNTSKNVLILSDGATKNKHSWARAIVAILHSVFCKRFHSISPFLQASLRICAASLSKNGTRERNHLFAKLEYWIRNMKSTCTFTWPFTSEYIITGWMPDKTRLRYWKRGFFERYHVEHRKDSPFEWFIPNVSYIFGKFSKLPAAKSHQSSLRIVLLHVLRNSCEIISQYMFSTQRTSGVKQLNIIFKNNHTLPHLPGAFKANTRTHTHTHARARTRTYDT